MFGSDVSSLSVTPPDNFQRTCVQIWSRVLRVVMHIYWHHWEHIVKRDSDVLLNNYTKHFIVFALKHKLIVRFDAVAPIFDLLGTILPPNYHKQLQDMEKKVKDGSKPSKKVKEKKEKRPKAGRGRRALLARGALNQQAKLKPKGGECDDFDFEDDHHQHQQEQEKEKQTKAIEEKNGKESVEDEKKKKEEEDASNRDRSVTVVQIPLEVLNSFSAMSDPSLPSPTVFVRGGSSRNALPSLPPTFNPEEALNRLYAKEGGEGDDEGEDEEGDGKGDSKSSRPFRRSKYLTQEEMEEFMTLKEDERREWVKRKQQLPNTLSDNKVRYEAMTKENK